MRPFIDGLPVQFPGVGWRGDDAPGTDCTWSKEWGDTDGLVIENCFRLPWSEKARPYEVMAVSWEVNDGAVDAPIRTELAKIRICVPWLSTACGSC